MITKTQNNRLPPIILKYENQLDRDPNSLSFAALAEAYRKLGDFEKAFLILKTGIKNHPTYKFAYFTLAHCYYDVSQYQLTYSTLRPFISTERENFRIQQLFAETCIKLGQKEEALESLKYCLFISPKSSDISLKISEIEKEFSPTIFKDDFSKIQDDVQIESAIFDVRNLNNQGSKQVDIDEWIQVDISKSKNSKEANLDNQENWEESHRPLPQDLKVNEKVNIHEIQQKNEENAPIITHTLVDLYCAQGLHQKGMEILAKILELNPNDFKTKERLNELQKNIEEHDKMAKQIIFKNLEESEEIVEPPKKVKNNSKNDQKSEHLKLRLMSFLDGVKDRARQISTID